MQPREGRDDPGAGLSSNGSGPAAGGDAPARGSTRGGRSWLGLAATQAILLSTLGPLAYYQVFSRFVWYDDEGYMMLTVKHFLAGHRLYDEVWTLYGPIYFLYKWFVHGMANLPLTHDVVRLTAAAVRLATGVVASAAVFGLTGSLSLAAVAQMLSTLHLFTSCNEPGHPQELAGLLTMVVVTIPAIRRAARAQRTIVALGLVVAALAMVKSNLGILAGLAVWMSVLALVRVTPVSLVLRITSVTAMMALPALLMRAHLAEPWGIHFAATATLSILALGMVAFTERDGELAIRDLALFVLACAGGLLVIVSVTLARGTTGAALLDCLIVSPMRMPGLFVFAPESYFPRPFAAGAAILLAVAVRTGRLSRVTPPLLAVAKLWFGARTLAASWGLDAPALLSEVTPFLWLTLALPANEPARPGERLARLVLCWVAVLQPLQAYPVAGSQIFFGTVVLILCGAVCVHDVAKWLQPSLSATLAWPAVGRALAGGVLLVVLVESAQVALLWRAIYGNLAPLGLPGAERIHLVPEEAELYRVLVKTLRERAGTFLAVPGFSSLYFWTGEEPPTLDVIGHEMRFYSEQHQAAMLNALLERQNPVVVRFQGLAPPYPPFEERVDRSFKPLTWIGPYQLLVRR